MRLSCYPSSPCVHGSASSFYRARGGSLQSRYVALSAACGSMSYNAVELASVLANLASGRRRDGSCACPGAAPRVVGSGLLFDRRPYANSRAWLMEDRRLHSSGRGDVLSTWVSTVLGMTLQCPRWRHSGGDGRAGPEVIEKTRPVGLTSWRHPGRVRSWWPYLF
jgi:hypothetical protein